ncbi:restriction endonuclease [Bacillus ndiopicus]|uniref:restriction endonuclease n=1 Tax=Bacillus ndiopicus TaxID=1347368 RepID=UPI000AAC50CE|nr:restriction endonuclease [Bacillus ndiopicus]
MADSFPKDITDSMRTCILSIFWPKKDIISFFVNNGCTKQDLKHALKYEELNLSRSKIIDCIFENLNNRNDGGLGQFRAILQALLQWNHYDPYYFETLKKLDKAQALRNINHLRQLQEIRDAKIKQQIESRESKYKEALKSKNTLEILKKQYLSLYQGKDEFNKPISLQKRGYLFEELIRKLLIKESIQISDSIKLIGEQIDGTIKYDGENYIIEAKWQDTSIASNALYHFAYKVEGKLYGRGIFISVNGFSVESIKALVRGKTLNTILIDGADLMYVMEGLYTLNELLDNKIKAAQTMGKIYIDVITMKEKVEI